MTRLPFTTYRHSLFIVFITLFFSLSSLGQQTTWAFNLGSTSIDQASGTHIDLAGNVYTTGEFRGTVDFDPSPATALKTSNGNADAFVAKYSTTGQYLLSITFGGSSLDRVQSVTTDATGNIYITGFFRGSNVDFDP